MKKIVLSVIMCLLVVLSFTACGKGKDNGTPDSPPPAPPEAQTTELSLYLQDSHIMPGKTTKAIAFLTADEEEKEAEITFAVDNTAVATVDGQGTLSGKAMGTTTVTATCQYVGKTYTASKLLTVNEMSVLTVMETEIKPVLGGGDTKTRYEIYYKGEAIALDEVSYKMEDEKIATVDAQGNVRAVAFGSTTLTVLYKELSKSIAVVVDTVNISTAAQFMNIQNTLAEKYTYVLQNDIDLTVASEGYSVTDKFSWGADKCESYPTSFKGILDGKGHSVKMRLNNGVPHPADSDPAYDICFIGKSEGTIKNVLFDIAFIKSNGRQNGLVKQNFGTVENVAYKASYVTCSDWDSMHISMVIQNFGAVQNIIAIHDMGGITSNNNSTRGVYVVGANYRMNGSNDNGAACIQNCINLAVNTSAYLGDTTKVYKIADVGVIGNTGNNAYTKDAFFTAVTDLRGADGWSGNWALGETGLGFGGKMLLLKNA